MERVTGMGGVFFAARDADALKRWYSQHLGVGAPPHSYEDAEWQLRAAGVDVEVDDKAWPNGRFISLHDPEGNPVQLWEPAGP